MTALYWIRNDLRFADNPALSNACAENSAVIPLYIFDEITPRSMGSAQRWWLHHSLKQLQEAYLCNGSNLILRRGIAAEILLDIVKKHNINTIYWNQCFEPHWLRHDKKLIKKLQQHEVQVKIFNSSLLINPQHVKNKSGDFFKVFTPFSRAVLTSLTPRPLLKKPSTLPPCPSLTSDTLESWKLLPKNPEWSTGFSVWNPGEENALILLEDFVTDKITSYTKQRDIPAQKATSHLSPYLHFGEIGPWQIWHYVKNNVNSVGDAYLRQLLWREFAYYFLFHQPTFFRDNFRHEFDNFPWKTNKKYLRAWQQGLTGYPIVDAGMRELWHTGIMHNRVRMITASFLTKDLLIDWRHGEKWFWDTLLDADLANNSMGWQWVAGCGVDAAPYFRIFNPVLQGEKFDPDGDYIIKWLPQLKNLPKKYLHQPFAAPASVLQQAGISLGENYPKPIVEHETARKAALTAYKNCTK